MTQEWNPPVEMTTTTKAGASGYSGGASSMRYYDAYGEVSPERMVLQEILTTLKRIEAALTSEKR